MIVLTHNPIRKLNVNTKSDKEARKSDDLLKRNFKAEEPYKKCVTDITELKASDGKLRYITPAPCPLPKTHCEHTYNLFKISLKAVVIHTKKA